MPGLLQRIALAVAGYEPAADEEPRPRCKDCEQGVPRTMGVHFDDKSGKQWPCPLMRWEAKQEPEKIQI
jgi:hypothetical protein